MPEFQAQQKTASINKLFSFLSGMCVFTAKCKLKLGDDMIRAQYFEFTNSQRKSGVFNLLLCIYQIGFNLIEKCIQCLEHDCIEIVLL